MNEEMKNALSWPLDPAFISRKRKKIKRELLEDGKKRNEVRIAILGGSTTNDVQNFTELFLLNEGLKPSFYASEYGKYWEDGVFGNEELSAFGPQIIYIHTSSRNITDWPEPNATEAEAAEMLDTQFAHFEQLWESLENKYGCTVIQNNFERPLYRLLGNQDICKPGGASNYVHMLNDRLYKYAQTHDNFFIHDIDFLSADYGLAAWHDAQSWSLYKSAFALQAGPAFAYSLTRIIKSLLGKNKKALSLDLDNTMWGGIVGDDGVENLEIGNETAVGQSYLEFQQYLKELKKIGVILSVNSKNDEENAIAGLNHPDGAIRPDDFIEIKANWSPKDMNLAETADDIGIGIDSFVFVDDNPAERAKINMQYPDVTTPPFADPGECISVLDHAGFFETVTVTGDDAKRNEMYKANVSRKKQERQFADYDDYLRSLDMHATISDFDPLHISRIAQLTNKTNQFNLTTKRIPESEMRQMAEDSNLIRLSGRLEDKFGDNGLISVVIGRIEEDVLNVELWLMSCRVLKRGMEQAMFDELVRRSAERGVKTIKGYYYPTAKNGMVKNLYGELGFNKISEDAEGNAVWQFSIGDYTNQNKIIDVITR